MVRMTTEEHMLMVLIFYKQRQAIQILIDMLKSRGTLTGDDEAAFSFAQTANAESSAEIYRQARKDYMTLAQAAGVETGLQQFESPPSTWFQPE